MIHFIENEESAEKSIFFIYDNAAFFSARFSIQNLMTLKLTFSKKINFNNKKRPEPKNYKKLKFNFDILF
jgi:hypothetical protein